MKRWFLAAVLVILVGAFAVLTQGVHKSSMTEDEQQQAAQEAQQKAQKAQEDKAAAAKQAVTPSSSPASTDNLPAEEVVGDPATAKHHIQVGWVYEDTDAANASKLEAALAEVRTFAQKSGGATSAVLVDLDVPAEDRSSAAQQVMNLGMEMDGQSVYDKNPDQAAPGTLTAALQGAAKP